MKTTIGRRAYGAGLGLALCCGCALPAGAPLIPVTVCEIVRDLPAQVGKSLPVLGRYSFREAGRSVGEQACDPAVDRPAQMRLVEDGKTAPKPPGDFELDGAELNRKFAEVKKRTSLANFRFGTPDYDRWAVIYGRVEARPGAAPGSAAAELVIRGDGVILFLNPPN